MSATSEKREFQTETRQLLDLMIHSVYSNPDTFLRELISNASDALDKLRLASLTDVPSGIDTSDLHIQLLVDAPSAASTDSSPSDASAPAPRRLAVRDNGIGMSRDEVIDLIGTLARSGTAAMRAQLAEARAAAASGEMSEQATADLIGQFGIGFYSTFMVADTVTLVTRKAGEDEITLWRSAGEDTYEISTVAVSDKDSLDFPGDIPTQGTTILLDLKPTGGDTALPDYTSELVLREIVRKYSDFIAWPIRMEIDATSAPSEDNEAPEPATEVVTLNSQKALWTRPQTEVSDEEYAEFYRHIAHAWDEPAEVITFKAEGTFEYQALLFIPSQAPFDLFSADHRRGVQLYVRRVFIMDDAEALIPQYLRFIRGVVDAQDLSLNVSREILQQDRQITAIRKRLVRKVLQSIAAMRNNDREKFNTVWAQFGEVLKEGLISDTDNRDQLLKFVELESTHTASSDDSSESSASSGRTTLAEYVERFAEGQTEIYYLTGPSRARVENSPHLEAFRARGVEVLLLSDPVDGVWVEAVGEFEGKPLRSIAKGDIDLDGVGTPQDDKDDSKAEEGEFTDLLEWLGTELDEVKQVRLSHRLVDSAACMVGDTFDMTPQLERLYRAQGMEVPHTKRILEINPKHPLVKKMQADFAATTDADSSARETIAETGKLLVGIAVLAEGEELDNPAEFASLLSRRL